MTIDEKIKDEKLAVNREAAKIGNPLVPGVHQKITHS